MNVKELNQIQTIEVYTCSKCGKPNACDPARCCINGDFNGVKIKVEIPKVTGKYYTEYFDDEDTEVIGRLIRSSEIKKVFQDYVYAGVVKSIMGIEAKMPNLPSRNRFNLFKLTVMS